MGTKNYSLESITAGQRTELGKKLLSLRERAIATGLQLLNPDEVIEEVNRRRSGEQLCK